MKKVVLVGAIALLGLSSCKKEETVKPTNPVVVDIRDQMVGDYSLKITSTYKYNNVSSKENETTENLGTFVVTKNTNNPLSIDGTIKIGTEELKLAFTSVTNSGGNIYFTIPTQTLGGETISGSKSYISASNQFDGSFMTSYKNIEFILLSEIEETIDGVTVYVPVEQKMIATKN